MADCWEASGAGEDGVELNACWEDSGEGTMEATNSCKVTTEDFTEVSSARPFPPKALSQGSFGSEAGYDAVVLELKKDQDIEQRDWTTLDHPLLLSCPQESLSCHFYPLSVIPMKLP